MRVVPIVLLVFAGLLAGGPARAQWSPVNDIPNTDLFSLFANGDTIATGLDSVVYVSTNAGQTWKRSSKPVAGVVAIEAVKVHRGRLYAGTFGQGAFVSDDLGTTWSAFNQGLVGGIFNTQLLVVGFQVRGDSIYAATEGAGVYVRSLAPVSSRSPFGTQLEPNQASSVNSLALGGGRLLVNAGTNGQVFFNDPGDTDWSTSNLDNLGIHAGLSAMAAVWNGTSWVVGTNLGVFRSVAGEEPWTRTDVGFDPLRRSAVTSLGSRFFGAFVTFTFAVIEESDDGGATWQNEEDFPGVFIRDVAVSGSNLYAARGDGLWRRPAGAVSVGGPAPRRLAFAVAGSQPFGNRARLRFELPEAGSASIEIFDVLGRRVGNSIGGTWSAGPHEVAVDATSMRPGVYAAVLTAGGVREFLRLVRVR